MCDIDNNSLRQRIIKVIRESKIQTCSISEPCGKCAYEAEELADKLLSELPLEGLDYKQMVRDIDNIIEGDENKLNASFDLDCKLLPNSKPYTQAEAVFMATQLGNIYRIAHCIDCSACSTKYFGKPEKEKPIYKAEWTHPDFMGDFVDNNSCVFSWEAVKAMLRYKLEKGKKVRIEIFEEGE